MEKKSHAKSAKDAKAHKEKPVMIPPASSPFSEPPGNDYSFIPLRPYRLLREASAFELNGSGLERALSGRCHKPPTQAPSPRPSPPPRGRGPGCTAIELARSRPRIFSL